MIWINLSQITFMEPPMFFFGTLFLFLSLHLVRRKKIFQGACLLITPSVVGPSARPSARISPGLWVCPNTARVLDAPLLTWTTCLASDGHPASYRSISVHHVPWGADLNIKSSGSGCIKVQNIECDNCKIETEQGTSILQSVKSQKLCVQTKGGKVICLGTIYGNIDIHASDKSTVTIDKLQGSSVNISTEDGLLKAKYLYTESSFLSSAAGDITLGSVHGNITLQSKMGNITVGSVLVKVPSSLQVHLQLSGKEVNVSSEVQVQEMAETHKDDGVIITGLMNQGSKLEKWIKADAPKGTKLNNWAGGGTEEKDYHMPGSVNLRRGKTG
ncbi:PREDICTED: protein FAM185A [Myotis brandtii]|uniref:protein FAM185A n=1 Tax=Myotis brandtii TaxID=109478 RepID=UPI00070404C5|nr:PREDICTED: protein FAM185A [Myotis brandtii]